MRAIKTGNKLMKPFLTTVLYVAILALYVNTPVKAMPEKDSQRTGKTGTGQQAISSGLVFISHPDWHTGDLELGSYSRSNGTFEIQETILTDMQQFGPKYILLAGDMIGGVWLGGGKRAGLAEKYAPGGTDGELVLACAKVCYDGINQRFRRSGMEPIASHC